MLSTFGALNAVASGLYAQQAAINTVGHNVANASTEGYSRQRANLVSTTPQTIIGQSGSYQLGTGVDVASVTRARDSFIDQQYWKENSTLSASNSTYNTLGKVENALGEPTDTGIQSVLNNFWQSWQTLSTNASDEATRTTVRERGAEIVSAIKTSAQQLQNMVSDINDTINARVGTINQYAAQISDLNRQISITEASGTDHANDLRDKRDLLIDNLSTLGNVSVNEDKNGRYVVQFGTTTLVSATSYQTLSTKKAVDGDYGYEVDQVVLNDGHYTPITFSNGEMYGLISTRDSSPAGIKGYLDNLSAMSQFLLTDFNEVHRSGYGSDNTTGNNFFGQSNQDYKTNPVSGQYVKEQWLDTLAVNPVLYSSGVSKIAAKTAGASLGVIADRNNTGTAAMPLVFASGSYTKGDTATMVKIAKDSSGNVVYSTSTDGGTTWGNVSAALPSSGTNTYTFPVNIDPATATTTTGLTVTLNFDAASANSGDSYTFTLNKNSAASTLTATKSNSIGGDMKIYSATGAYTNGDTATNVVVQAYDSSATSITTGGQILKIKYSTDGGSTWASAPVTASTDGTFTLPTINGVALKFSIATSTNNKATDQYSISLSKGNVASGDNANNLAKRLKTDTSSTLNNASLDAYYSAAIGALGVQRQNANRLTQNQQTLVDQVENSRQSVSGVNMDEEMTNMITFQKGYSAAARVLTTMDEMLEKLINGTGMVGR
ncbi:MAG: flagellar hook-associated protein FlgK [Sporomusaceae bacterium]|nr:flagellar hook-associated protein FlgK [Sporomusaceae bacterium]